MTPQELKNSILQLAIQGKLVEQRPEEGSAAELYQQIRAKKQQFIKAGKIKKEKPLPEITEEEKPFEIPESWMWVRLGDIVRYSIGKTPPRMESQWWGQGIAWVSIADMPESGHVRKTKESVTNIAISKIFRGNISKAGTLLMSFKLTVGRVSILDIDAVHNEAIVSIYPLCDNENIFQQYLFKILPFVSQSGDSKEAIKGRTLNRTSISNMLVPLPSLAEQRRIVAKIEELLPYIDRYEQAWSRMDALNKRFPNEIQKSILQLAVQGKLVEQRSEEGTAAELYQQIRAKKQQLIKTGKLKKEKHLPEITDEEKPFEIPESWMWVRLDEISYGVGSKYNQIQSKEIKKTGKYPVVSQGAKFIDGYTDLFDKVLDDPPILLFGDHTRNVKLLDFPFVVGADGTKLLKPLLVDAKYCYILLLFCAKTMRNRGYARHFSLLVQLYLPLPPLSEQKRIVAKIEELLGACEKLKRAILR